jgi:hypothetical protein
MAIPVSSLVPADEAIQPIEETTQTSMPTGDLDTEKSVEEGAVVPIQEQADPYKTARLEDDHLADQYKKARLEDDHLADQDKKARLEDDHLADQDNTAHLEDNIMSTSKDEHAGLEDRKLALLDDAENRQAAIEPSRTNLVTNQKMPLDFEMMPSLTRYQFIIFLTY